MPVPDAADAYPHPAAGCDHGRPMNTTQPQRCARPCVLPDWANVHAELSRARANLAQARLVLDRAETLRDYARAKLVSGPPRLRP
jgi:hypothetical protein